MLSPIIARACNLCLSESLTFKIDFLKSSKLSITLPPPMIVLFIPRNESANCGEVTVNSLKPSTNPKSPNPIPCDNIFASAPPDSSPNAAKPANAC